MRIVLTKAGKKEIILDEIEKVPDKNYTSEEKVKYSPKLTVGSKIRQRQSIQYNLIKFIISSIIIINSMIFINIYIFNFFVWSFIFF